MFLTDVLQIQNTKERRRKKGPRKEKSLKRRRYFSWPLIEVQIYSFQFESLTSHTDSNKRDTRVLLRVNMILDHCFPTCVHRTFSSTGFTGLDEP